ncbi:AbgT family transporter [Kocuria sp. cx-116]|uniref:AbgT family transporter n=1 Tax=Kocuria sp. cx-116 TaxID=2771378 RepID=UPI001683B412|nr:AbgT family transporter [Kocuria sp. cx-116]MBD2762045.1 AbgT family transporter [Kocuria sp. cx-116]
MSSPSQPATSRKRPKSGEGPLLRVLNWIEWVGNKLPDPFWLFFILAGIVLLLSWILSAVGLSAVNPATDETIRVTNLLAPDGLRQIVSDAVTNFVEFPPLGLVVVILLGVAVAEESGMLSAALRGSVSRVGPKWLTFVLALTGITGSIAADAMYVVLIPLGALAFKAAGRSPVVGLIVAFCAVAAGFNASLLPTASDALLAGITTAAAGLIDDSVLVTPISNYFFTFVSSLVLAAIITVVTETVLAKRGEAIEEDTDTKEQNMGSFEDMFLTPREKRGLRNSGIAFAVMLAMYLALLLTPGSPLRAEDGSILMSPLLLNVGIVIALMFAVMGWVYGRAAGTMTRARQIPEAMAKGLSSVAPVLVLFFAAAQFTAYFQWSGIGPVLAVYGADFIGGLGLHPIITFTGVVAIVAVMNLLITSGSAQWTLLAPVMVPMLMLLNVSPEMTQALFRIGDSPTNVISPVSPYFALVLGYLRRYQKEAGVGTLISLVLPISIAMLVGWFALFVLWYVLGIPLGPQDL